MRRMKTVATTLLLLALVGAVISWPYRENFWGGLILASFEAALVGALADWFAITALFRHPLGMKFIPHTAVIPNNRRRIIDSIVYMVENQWLRMEVIKEKIKDYELLENICRVLQTDEGRDRLRGIISTIILNTIKDIKPEQAAEFLQRFLKDSFSETELTNELADKLEQLFKKHYGDDIIDFFIDRAEIVLQDEDFRRIIQTTLRKAVDHYSGKGFFRRLGKGIGESLDLINYSEAAESTVKKLSELLEGLKSRQNPHRIRIREGLANSKLVDRGTLSDLIRSWVQKAIHGTGGDNVLQDVIVAAKEKLFEEDSWKPSISQYFTEMVIMQLNMLNSDQARKQEFEEWVKGEVLSLIERYHGLIGKIVRENLQELNDDSFVQSLEERVGEDLQWIRINGTVIGAAVGTVLYLISHMFQS